MHPVVSCARRGSHPRSSRYRASRSVHVHRAGGCRVLARLARALRSCDEPRGSLDLWLRRCDLPHRPRATELHVSRHALAATAWHVGGWRDLSSPAASRLHQRAAPQPCSRRLSRCCSIAVRRNASRVMSSSTAAQYARRSLHPSSCPLVHHLAVSPHLTTVSRDPPLRPSPRPALHIGMAYAISVTFVVQRHH